MIKSEYLKNKYKFTQINNFHLFYYMPINKADINNDIHRLLHLNKLKHIILPSSFKFVKDKKVQGPRIGIIYSSDLSYQQLSYLNLVETTSFKLKNKYYAYQLLKDLQFYKNARNLCIHVDSSLNSKNVEIFKYIKSFSLKNAR